MSDTEYPIAEPADRPLVLVSPEYHRFMFDLLYFSGLSFADIGAMVRVAHACMYARISFYGKPAPGITEKHIIALPGQSKKQWQKLLNSSFFDHFFCRFDGFVQLRPHYDFWSIYSHGRKALPQSVKLTALTRDRARCVYCGDDSDLHFDHLWPVAKGGSDDANNIVMACRRCNLSKRDKTLAEWRS